MARDASTVQDDAELHLDEIVVRVGEERAGSGNLNRAISGVSA
jgi:hypothetical protein